MRRVIVGIDPGLTRQGVVVVDMDTEDIVAWATFHSNSGYTHHADGERVHALSNEVGFWLENVALVWDFHVAIETPVLNTGQQNSRRGNPATFGLQWRNVQQLLGLLDWETCTEVHNTAVKQALTGKGNASKDEIVAASPVADLKIPRVDKEALADAYSVAIAAIRGYGTNIVYSVDSEPLACHDGPCVASD